VAFDRRQREAFSDEMLKRLAQSPEMATVRHTVQVTSFGGSGTTALYEHFQAGGADIPATVGQFPFKHQRVPPADGEVPPGYRVVYLYADPRNAVVSLFRRGFQGAHYRGMQLRTPTPAIEERLIDLDHFLAAGIDDFEIADHVERWQARNPRTYPVMFLRFDQLPNVWSAVRDFVGLPADYPCLEMRTRASEWQALPAVDRDRLEVMYGDLAGRLAAEPDVEVR
jgi:hypothetical protein